MITRIVNSKLGKGFLVMCATLIMSAVGARAEEIFSVLTTLGPNAGDRGVDLMVTDTATGTTRNLATVVTPNEGIGGGGDATGVTYNPVERTVSVGYRINGSGGIDPRGTRTYNADTGELISDISYPNITPVSFTGSFPTAFYTLPDQANAAQLQQNAAAIERNTRAIERANQRIDTTTEGVAMAMAMGGVTIANGKVFALSGGWGTFEGTNALGFGSMGKVSEHVYLTGGLGLGLDSGTMGGRAGFLLAW